MEYTDDSQLPEVTDEELQRALPNTQPCTIVILKARPRFEMPGPDRASDVATTISTHGKRNYARQAELRASLRRAPADRLPRSGRERRHGSRDLRRQSGGRGPDHVGRSGRAGRDLHLRDPSHADVPG